MQILIRADSVSIEGYVNAVGRDSRRMSDADGYPFVEQMEPGVFAKALQAARSVDCLLDHNKERVLATTNDTLELEEDSIGLHANVTITDPEVIEKARDGKLRGWSFGFTPLDSKESYSSDVGQRSIITELDLKEVSIIDDQMIPCYAGTSIHTRADGTQDKICFRSFDNDVIVRSIEEPASKPDYTPYDEAIKRLQKRSK